MLNTLTTLRPELCELRDVSIHLSAPQLPRVAGRRRNEPPGGSSVLARAVARALPPSIINLAADLRGGGGMLSGDIALADFSSAIPKGLVRLRLDLNQCSPHEIKSVAGVLPQTLQQLELLFHSRRASWLTAPGLEDDGLDALAKALPTKLERLALKAECADRGAGVLCHKLPPSMKELDLDLRVLMPAQGGMPAQLPQGLASVMGSSQLLSLHLRLMGWALTLSSLKVVVSALPQSLQDLRLDTTGRSIGDEGAKLLSSALPHRLSDLALCLRGWQIMDEGLAALSEAISKSSGLRRLMLTLPGSQASSQGLNTLSSSLPVATLEVLNLAFRKCDIVEDGQTALDQISSSWKGSPGSWVRVDGSSTGSASGWGCQELPDWSEWDQQQPSHQRHLLGGS